TSFLGVYSSYLLVYIGFIVIIFFLFSVIRRLIGEKLLGADVFGKFEYYLGMLSGVIRYCCIIIMFLAIVHGRLMSVADVKAQQKKQQDQLGNSFFPTFGTIQQDIFQKSYVGSFVKTRIPQLLIKPTADVDKGLKREGPAKRKERAVDEVINGPNSNATNK
ncbi:MAG: Colicin production protein, partial [Verrucomicrobiales bacterium]|nr:Colicin production protein [Verrucomicrobiales bacterium]